MDIHNFNEAFEKMIVKDNLLINADCFDIFPHIADKSIDAIICDLPYGTTKCKWDSILDLDKLWVEYKRVLKDDGIAILFAQTPFDKVLGCSNLKWLKYEWIWEKTEATGFLNASKMPMKAHENILIFYDKYKKFYPQKTDGHKPANYCVRKAEVANKTELYGTVKKDIRAGGNTDRFPRSVQKFSSDKQKNKSNGTLHPTQKPIALLEMLIKSYTDEGDMILDNTMGSGTTNLACLKLSRKSIGIEKEKRYYDIAVKRMLSYYVPDIE